MERKRLGGVELRNRTIDFDLVLLQRYQEFSAELLRLSLIGIWGIGFFISLFYKYNLPASSIAGVIETLTGSQSNWFQGFLLAALGALATSAASSLIHRYLSTDAMACHLRVLRLYGRYVEDISKMELETIARNWRLKCSRGALGAAAATLAMGAVCLVVCMAIVLWPN